MTRALVEANWPPANEWTPTVGENRGKDDEFVVGRIARPAALPVRRNSSGLQIERAPANHHLNARRPNSRGTELNYHHLLLLLLLFWALFVFGLQRARQSILFALLGRRH